MEKMLRERPVDLMVLDLMLPGRTGLNTALFQPRGAEPQAQGSLF